MVLVQDITEGCDYTIDCGKKFVVLKADNYYTACREARELVTDADDGYRGERELAKAILVQVREHLPLRQWYGEYDEEVHREQTKAAEDTEKAELARLKEKYPDG